MLTKALPRVLREVREVVGERRITIVFDRGGWSPKLLATMIKDGFDVLTYRSGWLPPAWFLHGLDGRSAQTGGGWFWRSALS
jgi:hypothetical protein